MIIFDEIINIQKRSYDKLDNHFFYEVILVLLPPSGFDGGMYLGRLPRTKYDQYMSAVSITTFPLFYFPYSTGVKDT